MSKYKVGDTVWFSRCGQELVTSVCPICCGKLSVILTLGNGDSVKLPCEYCGKGFDGPTGKSRKYEYVAAAEQQTITKVSIEETGDGEEVRYQGGCYGLHPDRVFDTKDEAVARCKEIAEENRLRHETQAKHVKENQNKNYSWNAGYHLREAKRDRTSAERHERMAVICKAKAKCP